MQTDKERKGFEKPVVDEDYLMNIMSGDERGTSNQNSGGQDDPKENKPRERTRASSQKKVNYEELFLVNRYPSTRNGKVVYIRPEFHERLLRIVQLAREEKTTLYAYLDNILAHHFKEHETDITNFFNEKNKPIF